MKRTVEYFDTVGRGNTDRCIELLVEEVRAGHKHVVVASTEGDTGAAVANALQGENANVVVVTHSVGFTKPNVCEFSDDHRKVIEAAGGRVVIGTMPTHAIETAVMKQHQGVGPAYLIAQALRRFSEGTKVGVEICLMAVDCGAVPEGEEVLTLAGTGRGADTLLLVRSAASKRFLDLRVLEVLAKPR